ncbi:hypothetical protein C4573_02970 [Candidatus Woesearchaeota archaeon]|nr:MAG: hypothetical protein C4573_02970 [Candidatus Woesearchaeota archaeon]
MVNYKSEGERVIASILTKYNIDFVYEHPLLIKETKDNDTEKLRIWYPDFWLPKYNIIIEYWGRRGDPHYDKGKASKLEAYKKLNIDCISVYPETITKNLKSYLLIKIKTKLNEKVRHFENRNKKEE